MQGVGTTGRTRASVGATPTGVEIGIDIKIAQIGISTDYGGGIVIAIGGQKIVWGKEGGKIRYNIAGLELIVEARNCVVVVTKKIAGMVVERYSYPDPGCKLPDPPIPPLPPIPDPINGIDPTTITDARVGYVLIGQYITTLKTSFKYYDQPANFPGQEIAYETWTGISEVTCKIVGGETIRQPGQFLPWPPGTTLKSLSTATGAKWDEGESTPTPVNAAFGFTSSSYSGSASNGPNAAFIYYYFGPGTITLNQSTPRSSVGMLATGFVAFGPMATIARWVTSLNQRPGYSLKYVINQVIPIGKQPLSPRPAPSLPSPGNQPIMPESCCEALQADIADIKEVLATKEILAGKLTFPWAMRMPGGQGEEVIMDYPNLMRAIAQMIDHLGIHPPKLSIKDINNAIAGDQSLSNQFPSATQGFEALMAQVWDANADVDTLTNFLYRLSWLCVQQSMNLAVLSGKTQSILDMIGGATEPSETTITTPFNIGAGVGGKPPTRGQGFGKINKKIDVNTEMATESLLPDFLKIRENSIVVENFSGEQDIFDKLTMIAMKLETIQNSLKG